MSQYIFNKHNTTWKVLCTVFRHSFFFLVSEILLARCAHSLEFWYVNNSCVINTVRQLFPWSILFIHIFLRIIFPTKTYIRTAVGCWFWRWDFPLLDQIHHKQYNNARKTTNKAIENANQMASITVSEEKDADASMSYFKKRYCQHIAKGLPKKESNF